MGIEGVAAKMFRASAEIALPEPAQIVRCLCERFSEWGSVTFLNGQALIETGFGLCTLEATPSSLTLLAESADETGLAYVKLSLAEQMLSLEACRGCPRLVWQGDGAAGSPLPYFREMRVASVRSVTPNMRRVTLRGENLARFAQSGPGGGLHIRLLFPPKDCAAPSWPVMGADGRPQWPERDARPEVRIYTIRRIDVGKGDGWGEVDVDMVLHACAGAHGPGTRFAAHARPGDVVGMTGPGGGAVAQAGRYLLAGDETALPAIARILESLPDGTEATALIEVANAGEEQPIASRARLDLRWLHRGAREAGSTTLLADAVRAHDLSGDGKTYVWVGCEAESFRLIRSFLRAERGMGREDHLAAAYWRRGFKGDEARKTE